MAEQTNKVFEEIADYTSDQFLAEIGGSAGLFLGLSLLTIVEFFANVFLVAFTKIMEYWKNDSPRSTRGILEKNRSTSTTGSYYSTQQN